MKKRFIGAVLGLGLAVAAGGAQAQTLLPVTVEARGGLAFPTGDFADGAKTGWNAGVDASIGLAPLFSVYGGYEYARFNAKESSDSHLTDSGFRAGLKVGLPIVGTVTGISPYVLGGVIYDKAKATISSGGISGSGESDWKAGYELGAGTGIGLGPLLSFTPEVRYRSYKPGDDSSRLSYFQVSMGLQLHL
ncbi:MAG TPA: outer membrane beta-barrel protein [Longimicrobiaceae bacterium]|nr:outer membrane beta-barrel protein [Longimicrobiaceae bacterium]